MALCEMNLGDIGRARMDAGSDAEVGACMAHYDRCVLRW